MDAELLELQRLFEATQQAKASVRLSERNVVELVTKLQELGLLDSQLLHTVSGKEYMTQDHLRHEMEAEIKKLGRVSLIDLSNTIGVDLFYCERQAESILSAHDDLMLVQGDILSTGYWDIVAEEVNESLHESGQIALADLAARLNVGSEILTSMLEPRLGKIIHGKLEGGQLYTQAYVARIRAMICGAIRALMVPTNLTTVWSSLQQQLLQIDESAGGVIGDGKLFQSLFNGLLKEGAFCGSLRGGGSIWTPAVFEKAQHEGVESFYSQNSYVTYDYLRKLVIPQPKQFLQGKYADGIALDTVFIHSSLISVVDAAIEEAIDSGGWVDCVALAPSIFSYPDTSKLILLCPSVQKAEKESRAIILADTCVISNTFLKNLTEKLEAEVKELAKASTYPEPMPMAAIVNGISSTSKKKGSVGEDDFGPGKGSKSKRRGSKGKGASEQGAGNKGGKTVEKREDDVLTEEFIATRVLEIFPELEGAGTDDEGSGDLTKAIAAHIKPVLVSAWERFKQASFTAAAEDRRHRVETMQKKIVELNANLQLFTKALDLFDDDASILTTLHRHLLRTTASELADCLLLSQDLEDKLSQGDGNSSLSTGTPLTTSQRLALAKSFKGMLSMKCIRMLETLDGKVVGDFDHAVQDVAEECGIRLKKLDKKSEKSLLLSYKKGLSSEIEKENDPVGLLPKVVALLYVQVFNKALQAPGRTIAAAVTRLKSKIPDAAYTMLLEYQSATVALLSMLSTSVPGGTDCTSDRVLEKRQQLENLMPALKGIVMSSPSES